MLFLYVILCALTCTNLFLFLMFIFLKIVEIKEYMNENINQSCFSYSFFYQSANKGQTGIDCLSVEIQLTVKMYLFNHFDNCCLRAATDESQKTLNKCETRNKTVFDTRLRHPETINSVPLNSVLRIKQTCV